MVPASIGAALGPTGTGLDALGALDPDDSIARNKMLIGAVSAASKLLEAEREESYGWEGDIDPT